MCKSYIVTISNLYGEEEEHLACSTEEEVEEITEAASNIGMLVEVQEVEQ